MNSGKTTTVAAITHGLTAAGLRVGAMKVTGTGAGGDPFLFADAGAAEVLDFTSAFMDPISKGFVASIHRFCGEREVPLVDFVKGQRKDDLAHEYLAGFTAEEGVLFVGRAQEDPGVSHREAPQPGDRRVLSVDRVQGGSMTGSLLPV